VADDAGALLVRSGLVSSSALDEARSKIADLGGTVGEQLVASGIVADDALTDFYKQRLLVPQVNPNTLARLPAKVVAVIPSDMAIELRAIPVSLDNDNNLTVAMSDPSDRHAVDEISFFTGAYVVRAVATQMQIAWCLAHYYGHVTSLGKRLLQPDADLPEERVQAAVRPRPRGMTGEVDAMRHRGIVPGEATVAPAEPEPEPEIDGKDTEEVPAVVEPADDDAADAKTPRARSISGEIRVQRRAASIKPPLPEDDDSGPIVVLEMEAGEPSGPVERGEDDTDPAKFPAPKRRRPAEPDPPELAARAGEVEMKSVDRDIGEGPSIVVEDMQDAVPKHVAPSVAQSIEVSGEIAARDRRDGPAHPHISVEVSDEESAPVMIREAPQPVEDEEDPSAPILLDRKRGSNPPPQQDVVALDAKKPRGDRRTAMGLGAVGGRSHRDTIEAAPVQLEDDPTGQRKIADHDPTRVDAQAAPPRDDTSSDEILAAPPSPIHGDDTSPLAAPPRAATPQPSGQIHLANVQRKRDDDEDEDDDEPKGRDVHGNKPTMVMTAVELDEVIPGRVEAIPHLEKTKPNIDYDPVDDGWGPPGTTIPPPLLGAIPGVGSDTRSSGSIPIPNLDSQPLMVAPPSPPEHARPHTNTQAGIARALEQATERMLDLIRDLEQATERDAVVATMIGHLAETHRRAGFFAIRGGELSLFSITPNVVAMPAATVRLDRPSTLQDVVGTRLPYRGPMHDETSRLFLQSVLGACPPEILLVPITVRERVVGVLFGEHRMRHTFDDQLALAGRAAGNALERILKSKRG
jgi:hypothetical protein